MGQNQIKNPWTISFYILFRMGGLWKISVMTFEKFCSHENLQIILFQTQSLSLKSAKSTHYINIALSFNIKIFKYIPFHSTAYFHHLSFPNQVLDRIIFSLDPSPSQTAKLVNIWGVRRGSCCPAGER